MVNKSDPGLGRFSCASRSSLSILPSKLSSTRTALFELEDFPGFLILFSFIGVRGSTLSFTSGVAFDRFSRGDKGQDKAVLLP